jgi:uncharacterized protein (DUF433 family)
MREHIIDRGRGPEIKGTRVTVYCIMDWVRDGCAVEDMTQRLDLSTEQVQAALDYIAAHKEDVEAVYKRVLERPNKNPPWVEALLAKSPEELKRRILARHSKEKGLDDSAGITSRKQRA